jgi:toxin ParE1/3/4
VSEVRFSRRAREDLLDIWLYIARQTSQTAADRILDRVEDACRAPARHRELGPARPEIADEARSLVVQRWLALYRLTAAACRSFSSSTAPAISSGSNGRPISATPALATRLIPASRRRARRRRSSEAERRNERVFALRRQREECCLSDGALNHRSLCRVAPEA